MEFCYWVLGDIRRYWIVLLLGDIYFCCDIQYDADQTAVGTIHMFIKLNRRHHHRLLTSYIVFENTYFSFFFRFEKKHDFLRFFEMTLKKT